MKNNAQSTVEYIVVFAAVVSVFIAFLGPSGPFQSSVQAPLDVASSELSQVAGRLSLGVGAVDFSPQMQATAVRGSMSMPQLSPRPPPTTVSSSN